MILHTVMLECGHMTGSVIGACPAAMIPVDGCEQPKTMCGKCGTPMRVAGVVITNDLCRTDQAVGPFGPNPGDKLT